MLTIRAAKAVAYYEAPEFAADDYYGEGGRAAGRWAGKGADALGLGGEPDDGDLAALLAGRDPASGAALAGGRGCSARWPACSQQARRLARSPCSAGAGVSVASATPVRRGRR
jgi:hypothetical protein